jgi:hypothetical protein
MCRRPSWLILCVSIVVVATPIVPQGPQGDDSILTALTTHQQDLETDGLKFLFDEASKNDFLKYSATIFDLRPLRPLLHQIPPGKRSALQANLIYWADSYDALICYKTVTPLKPQLQREKSAN